MQVPSHFPPFAHERAHLKHAAIWHARFLAKSEKLLESAEQNLHRSLLRQSQLYGMGRKIDVPEVFPEQIEAGDLGKIYGDSPVVIKGLIRGSEATRRWSPDFLKDRYGHTVVPAAKLFKSKKEPFEEMTLADFVDQMRESNEKARSSYVMASSGLFAKHPELLDDLDLDKVTSALGKKSIRVELFLGAKGVGSPFHCASSGNLFCNVYGRKRWVLVSPRHSMWMYPQIGRHNLALYVNSPIASEISPEQSERYPLFDFVTQFETVLEPGDVLYVPPWWWHEVSNLDETIGVPIRLLDSSGGNRTFSLLTLGMLLSSPSSVGMLTPVMGKVLRRAFGGSKGSRDLYLSDDLTRRAHVASRKYDSGWSRSTDEGQS